MTIHVCLKCFGPYGAYSNWMIYGSSDTIECSMCGRIGCGEIKVSEDHPLSKLKPPSTQIL